MPDQKPDTPAVPPTAEPAPTPGTAGEPSPPALTPAAPSVPTGGATDQPPEAQGAAATEPEKALDPGEANRQGGPADWNREEEVPGDGKTGGAVSVDAATADPPPPKPAERAPATTDGGLSRTDGTDLGTPRPEPRRPTNWEEAAPWVLTIASALALAAIAYFLVDNVNWFREQADLTAVAAGGGEAPGADRLYRLHVYHIHLSMVKRSVALFSGFAVMFVGLAVAFYTLKTQNELGVESPTLTARLATASPGLVALVVGMLLILYTTASKDTFPGYPGDRTDSDGWVEMEMGIEDFYVPPFPADSTQALDTTDQ